MNRLKQKVKIKEPIRLRAKSLANGNKSLYLDKYYKGKRDYEFLRLYLIPEKSAEDKAINDATLKAATAIKAKRILEYVNVRAGIKVSERTLSLNEWIEQIIDLKTGLQSVSSIMLMKRLLKHLNKYRLSPSLADIDREFCIGFREYLRSAYALNSQKQLKQATQFELLNALSIILNEAVRNELLPANPMRLLNAKERIKKPESTREYLTPEEVKSMIKAASDNIESRDSVAAFLFCCFCGLRYSDVIRLTWENIVDTANGMMIVMTMKKTKRRIEIPIYKKAASFLSSRGLLHDTVFKFPHYSVTLRKLKRVALEAGIKKKSHSTFPDTLSPP
ncbi:MAG: site-specific integrase [Muribaculaceae bacterium]|nr:site-specific integrase [Muribaculaceae bacterium]